MPASSDPEIPVSKPSEDPLSRKLRIGFFAVLGLLVVLNVVIRPHHPHFGLEAYPGFWAVFGLAGALFLGRAAKGLAHTILGKDEDFYDRTEP